MSDSDCDQNSATKTIDLKSLLLAKRAEHASLAKQIEERAFEGFENDLNGLLRAEKSEIENALASLNSNFSEQLAQVQKAAIVQTSRMLWMLKLPLLSTAITCLAMVALCLLWFQTENRERVRMSRWQDGEKTYLIVDDPTLQLCKVGSIDKPKTTTVVLQPCKPVE